MRRTTIGFAAILLLVLVAAVLYWTRGTDDGPVTSTTQFARAGGSRAIPAPAASPADDGNWTMPGKDYASTRFSALNQITAANVGKLQVAFTFSTGTTEGFEAPPLVVGDTMYVVTPWPNNVFALDLTRPGAPTKWTYEPKPSAAAKGVACCGPVNRGAFYSDGRLFVNLLDGHTVAIDAESGEEIWRTKVADIQKGETITMAPLVAEGKVLVGNSGGEMGVRGRLTALDAGSGRIAWIGYSTGPDKDVLIGPGYKPYYAKDSGKDLGVKTWPGETWKIGGGPVWGWLSYDPELRLVYYGTGNPGPWNPEQREGDLQQASAIERIGFNRQSKPHRVEQGFKEALPLVRWQACKRSVASKQLIVRDEFLKPGKANLDKPDFFKIGVGKAPPTTEVRPDAVGEDCGESLFGLLLGLVAAHRWIEHPFAGTLRLVERKAQSSANGVAEGRMGEPLLPSIACGADERSAQKRDEDEVIEVARLKRRVLAIVGEAEQLALSGC